MTTIPASAKHDVKAMMDAAAIPGVGIAVIRDFEITDTCYLGLADVETGEPVTERTTFQAASISKPFCATVIHLLSERGDIDLDVDINEVMSSWTLPAAGFDTPVTIRDLLGHTGGLGDALGYPGYAPGEPLPSPVEIVGGTGPSNTVGAFRDHAPGGDMKYSGGGYQLLQLIAEDVTGRPLSELVKQMVFDPLKMKMSSHFDPVDVSEASRAHDEGGVAREYRWLQYPETSAAGMWTTPVDLAKYMVELLNACRDRGSTVVSTKIARAMGTRVRENNYGLGLEIQAAAIGHGGGNWGFSSSMMGIPDHGKGLAVMTNCWGMPTYEFLPKVTDVVTSAVDG
ncbi:MAG: serine hydrolase domain-containing protein [Pseudomonadota bacterium]